MRGPFVGREAEIAQLTEALESAVDGHGRFVLLRGSPGIGKTRLAAELAAIARERGVAVVRGRCHQDDRSQPYAPFVEALLDHARDRADQELLDEMGPGAPEICQLLHPLKSRFPSLEPPAELDPASARLALFEGICGFIARASVAVPFVLVVDDLQWAEPATLALLDYVCRSIAQQRTLVCASCRDGQEPAELGDLARDPTTVDIRLGGLPVEAVDQLIEVHGYTRDLEAVDRSALANALRERSDGNAFYIWELLHELERAGAAGSDLLPAVEELAAPEGVRAVVKRRLSAVGSDCRDLLELCSAYPGPIPLEDVGALVDGDPDRLISEGRASRLLTEPTTSEIAFEHDLVREAVYGSIPAPKREHIHQRIADGLESLLGDVAATRAADLAFHCARAGETADKVLNYSLLAGDQAADAWAIEDAARHYEQALDLGRDGLTDAQRIDLMVKVGEMQLDAAQSPEVAAGHVRDAMDLARRCSDVRREAEATLILQRAAHLGPGAFLGTAVDALRRSIDSLDDQEAALRARLLAAVSVDVGPPSIDASDEGLRLAELSGDPTALRACFYAWSLAHQGPSETEVVLAANDRWAQAARGDPRARVQQLGARIALLVELGRVAEAEAVLVELEEVTREVRSPFLTYFIGTDRALLAALRGRYEESERAVMEYYEVALRARALLPQANATAQLSEIRRAKGRWLEVAHRVKEQRMWPAYEVLRAVWMALIYVDSGRADLASPWTDRLAPSDVAAMPRDRNWLQTLSNVAELGWQLRDDRWAPIVLEQLEPFSDRLLSGPLICRGSAHRAMGEAAATLGAWDEATDHFERAVERNIAIDSPPWTAHARRGFAEMLGERGRIQDRSQATELAESALATYESLGMPSFAARSKEVLTDLERAGPVPRRLRAESIEAELAHMSDGWRIVYGDDSFQLGELKGLRHIAHLVASPDVEFHALELMGVGDDIVPPADSDAGAVLDPSAKEAYRRRLRELEEEIAGAETFSDDTSAARFRAEHQELVEHLAAAVGLGGRDRKAASMAERARINVTRTIKTAIAKISECSPALAAHLTRSIKTGTFCAYHPDPERTVSWRLGAASRSRRSNAPTRLGR